MKLPRVYPIVDVDTLRRRQVEIVSFVQQLLEGGAEILQLRNKNGSPVEILEQAASITALVHGTPCVPVMNDRSDLALLAGWHAVHLGQSDLPPAAVRRLHAGKSWTLGVSTHTGEQVQEAEAGSADYVAIGPIFGTQSKADAEAVVGLEGVRIARALTRKPLVAIGGITRENAAEVLAAGADCVAVIGGLFDPHAEVAAVMQDFLRRLR